MALPQPMQRDKRPSRMPSMCLSHGYVLANPLTRPPRRCTLEVLRAYRSVAVGEPVAGRCSMGSRSKSVSKSAIRSKAKPSRAASGAHGGTHAGSNGRSNGESAKPARPARDYSIAAVARTLDLLEALAVVGPAPLATVA